MELIYIELKRKLVYRTEVLFTTFASLVAIAVQMALWKYLYHNDEQMMKYMMGYVIYSNIIKEIYSNRIFSLLAEKIQSGDFVLDLIKPVNIVWFSYLKSLGEILAQIFLQVLPLFIFFFPMIWPLTQWKNFGICIIALFFGHILFSLIYMIIGFTSFIFIESWAFRRLMDDTIHFISGALMPIAFFPTPLAKIALRLPFHYLYDFPLRILLNEDLGIAAIGAELFNIMMCIFGLVGIAYLVYKISTRHCMVQGG